MDLTMEEFQRLADDKSSQAIVIADLERRLAERTKETTLLNERVKQLEMDNVAARLENMVLKNYITLSVEKIRSFVGHLKGIERFAFLKAFLEYVLLGHIFNEPNETTKAAIKEAMSGRNPNKVYDNVDDMFNDILNEE